MKIRKEYSFRSIERMRDKADELIVARKMSEQICQDEYVCRCPACPIGFLHLKDSIEMIGQCDNCFEEIKLL